MVIAPSMPRICLSLLPTHFMCLHSWSLHTPYDHNCRSESRTVLHMSVICFIFSSLTNKTSRYSTSAVVLLWPGVHSSSYFNRTMVSDLDFWHFTSASGTIGVKSLVLCTWQDLIRQGGGIAGIKYIVDYYSEQWAKSSSKGKLKTLQMLKLS